MSRGIGHADDTNRHVTVQLRILPVSISTLDVATVPGIVLGVLQWNTPNIAAENCKTTVRVQLHDYQVLLVLCTWYCTLYYVQVQVLSKRCSIALLDPSTTVLSTTGSNEYCTVDTIRTRSVSFQGCAITMVHVSCTCTCMSCCVYI